ncbi:hypothetical protein FXF50_04710 [Micromonospora sp. AP08]|uniref:DUF6745 domain-containing protein n=1 Tax=Micromonospora sp. AP08 TaxID=2604467 RepID=UPI0011DBEB15|nr:hypothetical protein [Micromonospora sp. AP08]TYB39684.1 hypothetical protein FXF50_04710 [Micromonospora sp. AP08]
MATIDRNLTASYTMLPAWFWDTESSIVDQDDEGRAVIRYCLNPRDWFFEPAWNYYPDWLLLATIDTCQEILGTRPHAAWTGCRDVALAAGPWWPLTDLAVMSERPTTLRVNAQDQLHAEGEPAVVWPDGSQVWARDGKAITIRHTQLAMDNPLPLHPRLGDPALVRGHIRRLVCPLGSVDGWHGTDEPLLATAAVRAGRTDLA